MTGPQEVSLQLLVAVAVGVGAGAGAEACTRKRRCKSWQVGTQQVTCRTVLVLPCPRMQPALTVVEEVVRTHLQGS